MQVAKALLDTAAKQPPKPQAPSLQGASFADLSTIALLLRFQEVSSFLQHRLRQWQIL